MSVTVDATRRGWHPVTGAVLVAAPAFLAALAVVPGLPAAPAAVGGLTAFLAMGAVAGFSVSGST